MISLQEIINVIYRHPKGRISKIKRFGGYVSYYRMLKADEEMKQKSLALPPIESYESGLPLYFLTGEKFMYQTLFCIASLNNCTKQKFKYHILDDGTLNIRLVAEKLPGAVVITKEKIETNLKNTLPTSEYPTINQKRSVYAHLKKITDLHTLTDENKWKMILDSDMLFWKEPSQIIAWLKKPEGNLFMKDSHQSYGYTTEFMEHLCDAEIPQLLNVGVAGIRSADINWGKIETWISALEAKEGTSYYLEQALTAMLTASSDFSLLPTEEYIVYPSDKQIAVQAGTLHHYVDLSKKMYFMEAWKKSITAFS